MFIFNAYIKLIKKFKAPTPAKWQRFGKRVLNITTFTAIPVQLADYTSIALIIFLIGIAARTLVEFTEENDN